MLSENEMIAIRQTTDFQKNFQDTINQTATRRLSKVSTENVLPKAIAYHLFIGQTCKMLRRKWTCSCILLRNL